MCEIISLVIFKYASSVEDSIKLFQGTTLYELPITLKSYSKHLDNPVFDEQLNYFKQLVNVERRQSSESNSNKNRWNDQSSENRNCIPESLPEPPIHHFINFDEDESYSRRSDTMPKHGSSDRYSKYQHNDTYKKNHDQSYGSEHGSADKSFHSHGRYRKPEHNSSASSMDMSNYDRDSYNNQSYDRKHRDYNAHSSSHWRDSANYNQDPSFTDDDNSANDSSSARDLRDTMRRKRKHMDSDYHNDTNASGSSSLDLRDTMYHNKNNRYENYGQQYEPDFNNRWSERNKNKRGNNSFSDNDFRNKSYNSDHYNDKNNRHQNHYANQEYEDQSFNQDNFQEHNNEYQNNYNDGYRRDKNKPNNYKYNQMRSQNMESSSRQNSSYSPYKRNNEGYEKRPFTNSYGQRGGRSRGKNYNRGGNDRSRQNYY